MFDNHKQIVVVIFSAIVFVTVFNVCYQRVKIFLFAAERVVTAQATYEAAAWTLKTRNLERDDYARFWGTWGSVGVLCAGLLAVTGGIGARHYMLGAARRRRSMVTHIEVAGKHGTTRIPVAYRHLTDTTRDAVEMAFRVEALHAAQDGVEQGFAYAQQIHGMTVQSARSLPAALTTLPAPPLPQTIPTFAELVRNGNIAHDKPLIFGFAANVPISGTWQDLYSCAIGGQSGTGKTSTLRSIICQSILQGCQFWLIDPHYPHDESLQATLTPMIGRGIKIGLAKDLLQDINATIDRRLDKREPSATPKILIIDEVLSVISKYSAALDIITRIGTEGRKVKVYGLFAGHSWLASRTGGDSAIRDNLTARIAHQMERGQARALLQDNDLAKQVKHLRKGQAVFQGIGRDPVVIAVPFCSARDVEMIANDLDTPAETHETPMETAGTPVASFGAIVRDRLTKIEMSQNKLAELAGVSKKDMSEYLNAKKSVPDIHKAEILRMLETAEKHRNTLETQQETLIETV